MSYNLIAKDEFIEYELTNTNILIVLDAFFQCISGSLKRITFLIDIAKVNNYAPEFSKSNYEIKIPTPLPKDFEVTWFSSEDITAIDYDLHNSTIEFSISGSDLFDVRSVETTTNMKLSYIVKIFTTQQITKLEDGEIHLSMTGIVS